MDDTQLLREYVESGSESAFEALVKRHVDMVYASALRQLRDTHLAQDATQAVFLLLARKAGRLGSSVILSGWLYRTTLHVAGHALRSRIRQQRREQEAAQMNATDSADELWVKLAPHLDGAIGSLNAADRDAVVLRFLQQRSFRDVAGTLGVSEDAAKKRVNRALEKLRSHLTARGIGLSVVALGSLLSRTAEAAPGNVVSAAIAASAGKTASTASALTLASGVARKWLVTKLAWAGAVATTAALVLWIAGIQFRRPASAAMDEALPVSTTTATLAQAGSTTDSSTTVPRENPRSMRLQLLSAKDNSPLTNAVARIDLRGPNGSVLNLMADANGVMEVFLPDGNFSGMTHWIAAPGHAPKCLIWGRQEGPSLPAEYVVKLDPGVSAAGRVIDENGQPVAGARLRYQGDGMKMNTRDYVDYRAPVDPTITDGKGEWAVDYLDGRETIHGFVKHPDYAETEFFITTRALTNVLTIKRGAAVSGVAVNTDGSAAPGVSIYVNWEQSFREGIRVKTDAAGRFDFPHVMPGSFRISASLDGAALYEKYLELPTNGLTLTLTLKLAERRIAGSAHLHGKVLDEAGEPIAGAHVGLRRGQPELEGVEWSAETDRSGRFEWNQAPEGPVHLTFSSWDYAQLDDVKLTAGDVEHVVTMKPLQLLTTRCRVTDKIDGQLIPRFRVMHGTRDLYWPDSIDSVQFAGEGNNGLFLFRWRPESSQSQRVPIVRVEADGYEPQSVVVTNKTEGDLDLAIELERASTFEGVVLTANGTPAAGAEVALVGKGLKASLKEPGRFQPMGADLRDYRTVTGADGSFRLASRRDSERLLIGHPEGWAVVPVRNVVSGTVYLQPWGRLEGILRIGTRAGVGQEILILGDDATEATMPFQFLTRTDDEGRFVFDKVPPGRLTISRYILTTFSRDGTGPAVHTQRKSIDVKPGDTTRLTIGGSGVAISGNLVLDSPRENVAFDLAPQNLRPASIPRDPRKVSPGYGFFCRIDGSFVAEDVPPGEYELEARVYTVRDRNGPDAAFTGLGSAERVIKVIVPEGQSELQLGDIVVTFKK